MRLTQKNKAAYLTEGRVSELIDTALREAIREQAREIEKYLRDIDSRLIALELRNTK